MITHPVILAEPCLANALSVCDDDHCPCEATVDADIDERAELVLEMWSRQMALVRGEA